MLCPMGRSTTSESTRRQWLASLGATLVTTAVPAFGAESKSLRGIFPIVATPYTKDGELDYEDLEKEVGWLEGCGVHGIVWPQLASEYFKLTREERFRGMEVIAKAHRGRTPALVFGVQGPNLEAAMGYLKHAEKLEPDAVIAIPPKEAQTLDDYREYYGTLASNTDRPVFMQTTGGAEGIEPTIEFLVELAEKHKNLGYIKEEYRPIVQRMKQLAEHRPAIKSIFSGGGGRGMTYEMRLGMDGTMPAAPYADLYPPIWDAYQTGDIEQARQIFSKLNLVLNCSIQVPGTRQYIMKMRGVFKTTVSRIADYQFTPEAAAEIEYNWEACKPYLRMP